MKNTTIGMNFCWNPHDANALEKYVDYIEWCDKHKIKIIRIIFSKWGLNCIYNKKDVITLKHIVHYASTKNINIIISPITKYNKSTNKTSGSASFNCLIFSNINLNLYLYEILPVFITYYHL